MDLGQEGFFDILAFTDVGPGTWKLHKFVTPTTKVMVVVFPILLAISLSMLVPRRMLVLRRQGVAAQEE